MYVPIISGGAMFAARRRRHREAKAEMMAGAAVPASTADIGPRETVVVNGDFTNDMKVGGIVEITDAGSARRMRVIFINAEKMVLEAMDVTQ